MPDVAIPPPSRTRNYILRHWRGECSLAVSYWVNGWLAFIAIIVLGVVVAAATRDGRDPWTYLLGIVLVWLFAGLALIWQTVGIWQAATRSRRVRGKRFWPAVAQVMAVLGVLGGLNSLRVQAIPSMRDALTYLRGDPELGAHGIRLLRGGTEMEISGPLTWGIAQDLTAALAEAPRVHILHLDSIGGRVGVALVLADIVSTHRLDTYVPHFCASACTVVYLAGRERWVGPRGRLGFHSGRVMATANPLATTIANMNFRREYGQYGLPAAFLDHVFNTPSSTMWFPTYAELTAAHVTTGLAPDGMFAVSGFGPHPDPASAEKVLLAVPIYAALQRADPAWPDLLAAWNRTVLVGDTVTAFGEQTKAHIKAAAHRLLPIAPEATLRQVVAMMVDETETIQRVDPEACWHFTHDGHVDLKRYLSPAQLSDDVDASTRLLLRTADDPQPHLPVEVSKAEFARVIAAMNNAGHDASSTLAALRSTAPHATYCPAIATLIEAALALPADASGSPTRAIFSLQ
jgi:hypothetical protein